VRAGRCGREGAGGKVRAGRCGRRPYRYSIIAAYDRESEAD
jgi:hypothetical protein